MKVIRLTQHELKKEPCGPLINIQEAIQAIVSQEESLADIKLIKEEMLAPIANGWNACLQWIPCHCIIRNKNGAKLLKEGTKISLPKLQLECTMTKRLMKDKLTEKVEENQRESSDRKQRTTLLTHHNYMVVHDN